jgi:hypothetical protein
MKQLINGIPNEKLLIFTEAFGSFLRATNQTHMAHGQPVNFSDLNISDQNREAVLSEAEASTKAYAESRNRNAQPKNLSGFDSQLIQSVKDWADKRQTRFRGVKRHKKSSD